MIINADCRDAMRTMESGSIDSIVTDPPYGLSFMGKGWDHGVPGAEFWELALHVLKPGGHLLAFGGTRTHHRLACAIEDAGWEIRDCLMWLYGSGFPKSLDVSKAIDKATGIEREDKFEGSFERRAGPTGNKRCDVCGKWLVSSNPCQCPRPQDAPQSVLAQQWDGWGTALKPAWEPIILARKPLTGTVAANVTAYGTGALNIDGTRITACENDHAPASLQSVLDDVRRISAALRQDSNGDTYPAHGVVGQDGTSPSDARYVGIRSRLYPNGVWCDLSWSGVRDSLDGCPACLRFGDEQSRRIQEAAQAGAPSLADALAGVDRELSTLRRIPNCQCDGHPSIAGAVLWLQSLAHLLTPNYTARNVECAHNGRLGEASADTRYTERGGTNFAPLPGPRGGSDKGRWPANLVLDESAAELLDAQSGERKAGSAKTGLEPKAAAFSGNLYGDAAVNGQAFEGYDDTGGASRFFYCAKASRKERGEGNTHPTVKPIELMRWLVRLITPSSGVVLDPFCGSGSTGCASVLEGFEFIGIDLDRDYCDIARTRIAQWTPKQGRLL